MISRVLRNVPRSIQRYHITNNQRSWFSVRQAFLRQIQTHQDNHQASPAMGRVKSIKELVNEGRVDEARRAFDRTDVEKRDLNTYKALIEGYSSVGNMADAQRLFDHIKDSGKEIDADIYAAIIAGYSRDGMTDTAWKLLQEMLNRGFQPDLATYNAVLEGFIITGQFDRSQELFSKMPDKDVITFNIMINGYLKANEVEKAKQLFDQMQAYNFQPDKILIKKMQAALYGKKE